MSSKEPFNLRLNKVGVLKYVNKKRNHNNNFNDQKLLWICNNYSCFVFSSVSESFNLIWSFASWETSSFTLLSFCADTGVSLEFDVLLALSGVMTLNISFKEPLSLSLNKAGVLKYGVEKEKKCFNYSFDREFLYKYMCLIPFSWICSILSIFWFFIACQLRNISTQLLMTFFPQYRNITNNVLQKIGTLANEKMNL